MPFAYALAKALARRLAGALAGQGVEQPFHRRLFGRGANRLAAAILFEPHRFFDQVARDLLDVAADIAALGALRRLDLDEGGVGQLGQRSEERRVGQEGVSTCRLWWSTYN